MRFTKIISRRNLGWGLVAMLISLPLVNADRPQQSEHGNRGDRGEPAAKGELAPRGEPARSEPTPRNEPMRAPVEHNPVSVDRSNHGSIRHFDTRAVEHPVVVPHEIDLHQRFVNHRDVEVDIHRPRFWHGFAFGSRFHNLRGSYLRVFVGNAPFFYDDGIFFQQVGSDYQEVYPPVGAVIPELPDGAIEISAGNLIYYYAGGAFYIQQSGGFVIAPPPMGVVVPELPPGAVSVAINNTLAYQFNGIYYQPVFVNGVTQYMTFMP